ncbi:MAG: glutamate--tRNA ligase [Bradymonadia bacterium]
MTVRTRVAPSPTGDPHVGTAYMALFNLAFARKHGGQFILRIEDTDRARSTPESEAMILESLKWLGLEWDEGPDVGGPHGPYRQSERGDIYGQYAQQLLDAGHAFRCFHTPEELAAKRNAKHDGPISPDSDYVDLSRAESDAKAAAGEPFVIRMKVPREGECVFEDMLRGETRIEWRQVDMQVLLKSDGMPTYHLANVVDDHLMGITHVIRGEEWISSAPKHMLLYQYFGWEAPKLCHMPLLRNQDKSKLSKRKNPTSIMYYRDLGILPEALINYLGMMAWSMPDGEEKFTLEAMKAAFTLDRISLGGPIFDIDKLSWLNGRYIREDYDAAGVAKLLIDWAFNADRLAALAPLVQTRMNTLGEFGPKVSHFFAGSIALTADDLVVKGKTPDEVKQALTWGWWRLEALPAWNADAISESMRATAGFSEMKLRDFLKPFFVALSGQAVSTPLFDTMELLGKDISRARVKAAIDALGGVGKKLEKRWRKALDAAEVAAAAGAGAGADE